MKKGLSMHSHQPSRRQFLGSVTAAALGGSYLLCSERAMGFLQANERPVVGCIGTGSRWNAVGPAALKFADCAAVCDVDANHAQAAKERVQKAQGTDRQIDVYEDYRKILERKDIDLVTIVTPDHWHTKIAIEAMQAGKDVYCEKPLTLTIDEGKKICRIAKQTGAVFQVGTQQRTEMGQRFLTALGLIAEDRIGKIKKVTCGIGGAPTSGVIPVAPVPTGLNWDMWLGQAPKVDYRYAQSGRRGNSRCHYEFRWWYEYSGGKMTDWGAHHVDIATWGVSLNQGIDMASFGPLSVKGTAEHPCEFQGGYPTRDDMYNTAHAFTITVQLPGDVEMSIESGGRNGILFEGDKGRFFVSRGSMDGSPVQQLTDNPLSEETLPKIYRGPLPSSHMQNFMDCVKSRSLPISDVFSHHRALTICHLANIAIRLNKTLKWDAVTEQILDDPEANAWQAREQRKGYEITV